MSESTANTLTYKGYAARIEFDPEDRILVGRMRGGLAAAGLEAMGRDLKGRAGWRWGQ